MTDTNPPLLVNVEQAAEILGLKKSKVYELAAAGHLERKFWGPRNFNITYASLAEYVERMPTDPTEAA